MKIKKAYQYPWRYNNSFKLLVDGADYFSAMLEEIQNAKFRILLEAYLFESGSIADDFIRELCSARKRGIEVFILFDEYGSKGLNQTHKQALLDEGVSVLAYNPVSLFNIGKSLKRDHRKLLAIDNSIAFIGGAGITDQFNSSNEQDYWHDVMLKITGDVVLDLVHSFNKIWYKQKSSPPIKNPKKGINPAEEQNESRIIVSSGAEKNEIIRTIISHIRSSKKRVWLTSPYFISSWKIRRALRYAAKRGIDVRLIFPGKGSDHKWVSYGIQRYYHRLLKSNILIYEFQPRFSHAKIILCDTWFTLGSSNFDRWNQFLNLDVNIEVYNSETLKEIVMFFQLDFSKSKLIDIKKWKSRSVLQHSKEWFAGLIITVLGFISRKFKR